jgi:4-aminobutyrate aminotransferase-like enzyme/Ser/Thr protein kinase RdoA (MazF antagonist)
MQLIDFLKKTYGLEGSLTKLEGELDENYLFEGAFGKRIFKLMRADCDTGFIEMQVAAHKHVQDNNCPLKIPAVIATHTGDSLVNVPTPQGPRLGWMISFMDGSLMAKARPWTPQLCNHIGRSLAELDHSLTGFEHPKLSRKFPWDLLQAAWISEKTHLFEGEELRIIMDIVRHYRSFFDLLEKCPKAVIHNDANEMNVFVDDAPLPTEMTGLIDFGDMTYSARIGEVAVASAYAMMDADDPLANAAAMLAGYHAHTPLQDVEIELFFSLIQTRLAVSVTNSAERKIEEPEDPYLVINEAPAWRLLNRYRFVDKEMICRYFRKACGLDASPTCAAITAWLEANSGQFASIFDGIDLKKAHKLDLSYGSSTATNTPESVDTKGLNARIANELTKADTDAAIGGWGEARPIYNGRAFGRLSSDPLALARTHHLGVDVSLPAGTAVHVPYAGEIYAAGYAADQFDYGGYVLLAHTIPSGEKFYSLYGHLDAESIKHLNTGDTLKAGEKIGNLGTYNQNGGWWPHLHLQLMTEMPPTDYTPPGACEIQFWETAKDLCPNPAHILNLPGSATDWHPPCKQGQLTRRDEKSVSNQKLTYRNPLQVARGWKHFLCDQEGRTYIDAYNNVPHVGHANPAVIEAVTQQMELVSTNTRYVHESLMAYAEALTNKLPMEFSKCLFTSSASEANELAIRLARKATGHTDMLVMEHGYHGITTGAMAISPYKFSQKGGDPQQDWVHVTPQPDPFRGRYRSNDDVASACALDTQKVIDDARAAGRHIAGFISECLPSVGGQLPMPEDSLKQIYAAVRAAGGVCIADDVQTSLGRLGEYFWGFEYQDVLPDMIVLGKPLGNGHPLAAVITTEKIASSFADGPEFFTTFGGSTVSCTAGLAVLNQIKELGLQENAREMGRYLRAGFDRLASRYPVVGDIRGMGLFWGLDLVTCRDSREPATDVADYVKNRLYDLNILIGTDGPFDNVLKIRPPMTFDRPSADALLHRLELILGEKRAQP